MLTAIIGGSGLTELKDIEFTRKEVARTPYGEPSGPLCFASINGHELVFMPRHGPGHTIPPHRVNYRANLYALWQAGTTHVIAVNAVGAIPAELEPVDLVVPDQIIDYTHSRKNTFFEGAEARVTHIDFTLPYSARLRAALLEAARAAGEPIVDGATYACTQGPRLETAAEIERIAGDGGDLVGMTGLPEAALAREAGLEYAALGVVVNHAAGRGESRHQVKLEDLENVMRQTVTRAVRILEQAVQGEP